MNTHRVRELVKVAALTAFAATLTAASGCARIHHNVVKNDADDSKSTGFRYYQGAWYLLVYSDPKLGKTGKLHFLPDQTAKMSATPYNFWASLDGTLDFENGILTQSKAVGDETVVPKAILAVAKEIIGAPSADTP